MSLTPEQAAALKTYIDADPTLSAIPNSNDGAFEIAAILNEVASPTFYVWSNNVTQDSIMQNGFDWTRVDNLNVGPARVWEWMFDNASRSIDASKPNVRAGIAAVWKGTAQDLAVRLAVYQHCERPATVVEKIFATGTGTTTDVNGVGPATPSFIGAVSYSDVSAARGS